MPEESPSVIHNSLVGPTACVSWRRRENSQPVLERQIFSLQPLN